MSHSNRQVTGDHTDLEFVDEIVVDWVDTATELVTSTGDEIVDTAVVVPEDADELGTGEVGLVEIEMVGKLGDVTGVLAMTLLPSESMR